MKVKVLVCGCHSRKLVPENIDLGVLTAELDDDLDVEYAMMHPLLCGSGGNSAMRDLLRGSTHDTFWVLAGCDPSTQAVYFGDVMSESGFPRSHVIPVDIRGMNTEQAAGAVLRAVSEVTAREEAMSIPHGDGFSG